LAIAAIPVPPKKVKGAIQMTRAEATSWFLMALGLILWTYGYFVQGTPAYIAWPGWLSAYLPNIQSETGMALATIGGLAICLQPRRVAR
jgi:hypothetical protein